MELELIRYSSGSDSTLGLLFEVTDDPRIFLSFTLEDEGRTQKIYGETRIPCGSYPLSLRTTGGFHQRYCKKFSFHKGMIEIENVPNFNYVLIHIGNDDDDTAGCLLVGDKAQQNKTKRGYVYDSTDAYKRIYNDIAMGILQGESWITIVDYDKPM